MKPFHEWLKNKDQFEDAEYAGKKLVAAGMDPMANVPDILEAMEIMGIAPWDGTSKGIFAARIKQILRGNVSRDDFAYSPPPMMLRHGRRGKTTTESFRRFLEDTENVGGMFKHPPPRARIKFADVKHDPTEKWHADLNKAMATVKDAGKLRVGEEIADYAVSETPYWKVTATDPDNNVVYLEPIAPNPYAPNADGKIVGAGGHEFTAHDFEVLSGEYESKKVDSVLDRINKKHYYDIEDVAYLLLGTVPVQGGPNGSQGGWYNVDDGHNRGHQKGMDAKEIMRRDAQTIKRQFGFSVPQKALDGTLSSTAWNNFVGGSYISDREMADTFLPEEDFSDPNKMAEVALSHAQRSIRIRNADELIRRFRKEDPGLEGLIRKTAEALSKKEKLGHYDDADVEYLLKEKFINLATDMGWDDMLDMFAGAPDPTNRKFVAWGYAKRGNLDGLMRMLRNERAAEPLGSILTGIRDLAFKGSGMSYSWEFLHNKDELKKFVSENDAARKAVEEVCRNRTSIKKAADSHEYHSKDANAVLSIFLNLCGEDK